VEAFDLVFVFAITQVAALMLAEPTAAGYAKSALVLAMIYWAWSGYAWATNAIDLGRPVLRLGYLAAMGASFGMAVAVPDAFGDETLWFIVPTSAVSATTGNSSGRSSPSLPGSHFPPRSP
jgi:low temperature requirement protein LtrA